MLQMAINSWGRGNEMLQHLVMPCVPAEVLVQSPLLAPLSPRHEIPAAGFI